MGDDTVPDDRGSAPVSLEPGISRTFVLCMVLSLVGAGFVLAATTTDWFEPLDTQQALSSEVTWRSQPVVVPKAEPAR